MKFEWITSIHYEKKQTRKAHIELVLGKMVITNCMKECRHKGYIQAGVGHGGLSIDLTRGIL